MQIDLSNAVEKKMQEMIDSGKLDKIVTKQIEEMVESTVRDVFSSYGDVAKQFKEVVKTNLKMDFSEINFAEYNHNMSLIIKKMVETILTEAGTKKFQEAMDHMMDLEAPAKMKLSELVDKFKEHELSHKDEDESGDISFYCKKSSYDYTHISMDESERQQEYSCKYRIMINKEGKMAMVQIDDKKWENKLILGGLYGFEAFLFKAYTAGTIITDLDPEDVETHWGHDEP
jgi:hypothetical protein